MSVSLLTTTAAITPATTISTPPAGPSRPPRRQPPRHQSPAPAGGRRPPPPPPPARGGGPPRDRPQPRLQGRRHPRRARADVGDQRRQLGPVSLAAQRSVDPGQIRVDLRP